MATWQNLGWYSWLRWIPRCTHPCTFPRSPLLPCPLLFPLQLTLRYSWTYLPRTNQSPFYGCCCATLEVFLCISATLSVSCWQCGLWAIQTCQQPLALCGQRVQQGVLLLVAGVYLRGWQMPDTHHISILLCFCGSNRLTISSVTYLHFSSFPTWYTGQWMGIIHCFGFYWAKYHFRSHFLLLSYHPINLEDPLYWGRFKLSPPSPLI